MNISVESPTISRGKLGDRNIDILILLNLPYISLAYIVRIVINAARMGILLEHEENLQVRYSENLWRPQLHKEGQARQVLPLEPSYPRLLPVRNA
jgi:hypothetical protein